MKKIVEYLLVFIMIVCVICMSLHFYNVNNDKIKLEFKDEIKRLIYNIEKQCDHQQKNGMIHKSTYDIVEGLIEPKVDNIKENNFNGIIKVNRECKVSLNVESDDYKAIKTANNKVSIMKKDKNNTCLRLNDEELKIGDEVECASEQFYVVSINDDSITLLSKYNLNVDEYKQDKNNLVNAVSFDKANVRISKNNSYCHNPIYGCNVYERKDDLVKNGKIEGFINEDSSIKEYTDSYAISLNLGDALLSYGLIDTNLLEKLGCSKEENTCMNSEYKWLYSNSYWTKSIYDGSDSIVWIVKNDGLFASSYACYSNNIGIRPIIEIKKASIKF